MKLHFLYLWIFLLGHQFSYSQNYSALSDSGRISIVEKLEDKLTRIDSIVPKVINKNGVGLYICYYRDKNKLADQIVYIITPDKLKFIKFRKNYKRQCKNTQVRLEKYLDQSQLKELCKYHRRFVGYW